MTTPPIRASVIVVAWRLVEEFEDCLDAIKASIDPPAHEVIVVLNGASESIAQIARTHPAVTRTIVREANIGFGAACNLGATAANAEYLVFLNDDTRVDPRWLSNLVAAADADESRGAVSSLLLNYEGTVQEAGSRVLSHGGTMQLGKGLDLARASELGMLRGRPVDYGSAAALLVRRAWFEKVGGFDPMFEPAYFEDVDLQLRLREAGTTVWFEPEAKLLHYAGRSTRTENWFRHFAANRSGHQFIERWAKVLPSAAAADDPLDRLCDVPRRSREIARRTSTAQVDDSLAIALAISRDYEDWLVVQLDKLSDVHVDFAMNPLAPSRKELVEQLDELVPRLRDLESRGPLGVAKMRIGLWFARRRETS